MATSQLINGFLASVRRRMPIHQAITLFTVFASLSFLFHVYTASVGQLEIRSACLERGLPPQCADHDAMNDASKVSGYCFVLGGVCALVSLAVFSALSPRLGRRVMISTSCFGFIIAMGGWAWITNSDYAAIYWRPIVIITTTILWCAGGILGLYLNVFAVVADITANDIRTRMGFYIILEAVGAILGIVSAQTVGVMIKPHAPLLALLATLGFILVLIFLQLFMTETVDPEVMKKPVVWSRANIINHLAFILPIESSKKELNADLSKMYDKVSAVYTHVLTNTQHEEQSLDAVTTPKQGSNIGVANDNITQQDESSEMVRFAQGSPISSDDTYHSSVVHKLNDISDNNKNNNGDVHNNQSSPAPPPVTLQDFAAPPEYIPHTNATLFLTISSFMYTSNAFGHGMLTLFYAKSVFHITAKDYANILSVVAIVKLLSSFIIVPIFRKYFDKPFYERVLLSAVFCFLAVCNIWLILAGSYTHFFIVNIIQALGGVLPAGLSRSLISNQFSNGLQSKVLSALASFDCLVFLLGGGFFNLVWILTSKTHPGFAFVLCAGCCIVGAITPWLMRDSRYEFENRMTLAVVYAKAEAYEKYHQQQKQQASLETTTTASATATTIHEHQVADSDL